VGGLDEGFFLDEEDADLCRRVRQAGWSLVFTPAAEAVHHLGRSVARDPERARFEYHRSHLRYYAKHNGLASRAALHAHVALLGLAGWATALGPGEPRRARRRAAARLVRLAFLGQ
jgi:GT2 family glycosyltransferase